MASLQFLHNKKNQKYAWMALAWILIAIGIIGLHEILLPFLVAALLAFVLEPVVSFINGRRVGKKKIPRWASVLLVFVGIAALLSLLAAFFLPELYREIIRFAKTLTELVNQMDEQRLQEFATRVGQLFQEYNLPVEIVAPVDGNSVGQALEYGRERANLLTIDLIQISRNMLNEILYYVRGQSTHVVAQVQGVITGIFGAIFKCILVLMITAFILVDTARIKRFLFRLVLVEDQEDFDQLLQRITRGLSGVVRGQLLICLVNASLTLVGLLILKIKFALTLATMAGIFSLIPIFGSIISTIPIALIALSSSPFQALLAVIWIILIHGLEANFLNPKILGNSAKIHPVIIVLALLTGEHYYGIIGALLAVPIASIVLTLFNSLLSRAQDIDAGVAKP